MATIMRAMGAGCGEKGRRCDGTCHTAKGPKCECICGGRYHGTGNSQVAQERLTKDWLGDDWEEKVKDMRDEARQAGQKLTKTQAAYKLFTKAVNEKNGDNQPQE